MDNKGALNLIAEYGSDSSDDEVPAPRVSTKRLYRDGGEPNTKRQERLPAPSFTLEAMNDQDDNPTLHEGRIRSFPYERGNWATYVYIPCQNNMGLVALLKCLTESVPQSVGLKAMEEFHLSLTKTVVLKYHWIVPFVDTLKEHLGCFKRFMLFFDKLDVYCNEEKTRTFIGLQIKTGIDTLLRLVECLDKCLNEFKLPKYYTNPSFHVSVAWCLGDQVEALKDFLLQLNKDVGEIMNNYPQDNWYIYVEHLFCKIGNKLYQFNLN